jgi:hypothetical protein
MHRAPHAGIAVTEPLSRIEAALERLGAEHEPAAGWDVKVLAQIEQVSWWRRLLRWKIAMPIAAAAVAAIVITVALPRERALALAIAYRDSGEAHRGSARRVGEIMRAAATGGAGHRAVWVYREDRLVVACPGGDGCKSSDDETIVVHTLTVGRYTIVALTSRAPVSPSSRILDRDVAAAERAGATFKVDHVTVR